MRSTLFKSALILFYLAVSACNLAPGSYPYAEIYEFNFSEEEVKSAINKFKQEHPDYSVPKVTIDGMTSLDLNDGQSQEPKYWYNVYFYYYDENQILFAWLRPLGMSKTAFAFVSINQGLALGNWKRINKDFSRMENEEAKNKFEERIIKGIKEKL